MKKCSHCQQLKASDQFHNNRSKPDGLRDDCKECFRESRRAYRQRKRAPRLEALRQERESCTESKACRVCLVAKPLVEFARDKRGLDGRNSRCKECFTAYVLTLEPSEAARRKRESLQAKRALLDAPTKKLCTQCTEAKPLEAFTPDKRATDGLSSDCRQCSNANRRRAHAANPEAKRRYYWENKVAFLAANKAYREQHPEKLCARRRIYREQNAERLKQSRSTPEARLQSRLRSHKRRALKLQNGGSFTPSQWKAKCESLGYICYLCGKQLTEKTTTIDHVIPLTRGGSNYLDNVMPACLGCNRLKSAKTLEEYLQGVRSHQSIAPPETPP